MASAVALVLFLTGPALAQVTPPPPATGAEGAAGPQDGQKEKKEKPKKEKKAKKDKEDHLAWVWIPHPSIRYGKNLRVDFRGRWTHETLRSDPGEGDQSAIDIARKRLGVEGEVLKAVAFQVERELVEFDPWRDVWVDYQQFTFARAQFGKFKLPFSVDENTSSANLDFTFRSMAANQLAPGRDKGWMFHGQVLNHAIGYEIGLFQHDGRNARTLNPARVSGDTESWRVTSKPFRNVKSKWTDIQFGYATNSDLLQASRASGPDRPRSGVLSHFTVNGVRRRSGFEFRARPGPFSAKAEYIRVTEERRGESVEDSDLSPLVAIGWYVSGTWAVTGETKSNGLEEPIRPFLQGGIGAVEAAVRIERLEFGSEAGFANPSEPGSTSHRADVVLGNSVRALTFGVNWYPNRWFRFSSARSKERSTIESGTAARPASILEPRRPPPDRVLDRRDEHAAVPGGRRYLLLRQRLLLVALVCAVLRRPTDRVRNVWRR
jgi:phosphate-selective porin